MYEENIMQKISRVVDPELLSVESEAGVAIIGESESMMRLKKNIRRVAESRADTVLVHGESGAGKELVARAIHDWSQHAADPFVEINCASIPENLLESELFGYERGAFTDAKERKLGLFEVAGHGTVFLDEIGEMPAKLQAKLLRVLECRRFKRVGGTRDIEFSGRIVAATNRRLEEEIAHGVFRADLYYRLNVVPIVVPPLRDRKTDIPLLVEHLLEKIAVSLGVTKPLVTPDAISSLMQERWTGNVRELKNILLRTVIFHQPILITAGILDLGATDHVGTDAVHSERPEASARVVQADDDSMNLPEAFKLPSDGIDLEVFEKSMLVQALERSRFNQTKAARLLHVTRHTLRYRLEKFGLLVGHA
jgi:two-component system, NtrC family, response regulator AtoC